MHELYYVFLHDLHTKRQVNHMHTRCHSAKRLRTVYRVVLSLIAPPA